MQIEAGQLRRQLIQARYKLLVSVRPTAIARDAFNMVIQALVDTVRASGEDSTAIEAIQKELSLQEVNHDSL